MNAKKVKNSAVVAAEQGVSGIFGAAHFIAQSVADTICHTEAAILSRGQKYDKAQIIASRRAKTKEIQQKVITGVTSAVNLTKRRVDTAKQNALATFNELQTSN